MRAFFGSVALLSAVEARCRARGSSKGRFGRLSAASEIFTTLPSWLRTFTGDVSIFVAVVALRLWNRILIRRASETYAAFPGNLWRCGRFHRKCSNLQSYGHVSLQAHGQSYRIPRLYRSRFPSCLHLNIIFTRLVRTNQGRTTVAQQIHQSRCQIRLLDRIRVP